MLSLLLRWGIQRGNSVLAKSSNPHHIRGNLEGCLGWQISSDDMHKLSSLDFQLRLVDGIRFLRPEGPFRCASQILYLTARVAFEGNSRLHVDPAKCSSKRVHS